MPNFGREVLNPNTTRQPANLVDLSLTEEQEDDDWISITLSADGNKVTSYIGMSSKLDITIVNKTKKTLRCQVELTDGQGHNFMKSLALFHYRPSCVQIELTPRKIGDTRIEIKVVVNMEKVTKTSYLTLCLCGLEPKIAVTSESSPTSPLLLNYGFLPESCHQTHTLSVKNLSNFDIPLLFTIKKQSNNLQMFSLVETSNDSINCSELEKNTSASCILHTGQTLQIAVVFISPEINLLKNENGKAEVRALLYIVVAESDNVILKEIALIGKVGSDGIISEPMVTHCKCKANLKFPKLTTTHKQLVWGSVCVGKQKTESCMLRNESNSTVKLQASLDDDFNSFKLINDQGQSFNELDMILHSMERVKFNVAFNPPKIGSAIARVIIKKLSSSRGSSNFVLPLHGYGGHVKVAVKGVSKDITGRMWLSMGLLDSANSDMCSEFILSNTGTLDAFAIIKVIPKGLEVTESDFAVNSPYLVIGAGASVSVTIAFHLQREVYKNLTMDKKDVIEIGVLEIITGDEPSRQRIRRMLNSAKNSYLEDKLKNSHVPQLCKIFPGEVTLSELEFQNDPDYNIVRMLNRSFICQEISLTVEKNLDKSYFAKSMMVECGAEGNSQMFTSLYSETIHNAASTPFTTPNAKNRNNLWNISPSLVILMPPHIVNAGLIITNKFQTSQTFEAQVSNSYLQVAPSTGTIQPNDEVMITVSCSPSFKTRERELQSVIRIYLENDVKEIKVHIKYRNN